MLGPGIFVTASINTAGDDIWLTLRSNVYPRVFKSESTILVLYILLYKSEVTVQKLLNPIELL